MATFDFVSVPRIAFGRGRIAELGKFAAAMGGRTLLVASAGALGHAAELLASAGVAGEVYVQAGEPTVASVEAAAETGRRGGCDVVIGLGGGSAMDAAKAAAMLLANGGAALDYMEVIGAGRKPARRSVPWIAVPTTAGTGAEVTRNAVVASWEHRYKASIRGEELLAHAVIVDPELQVGLPADVTAASGMDALCQCIESYVCRKANALTDALAMAGVSRAAGALRRAYADGADVDAREDMAMAALLSGICLTNAGLGAVHGFAAPLGANFAVPHGVLCAALVAGVWSANVAALRAADAEHPAMRKYAELGRTLDGRPHGSDADAIEAGAEFLRDLVRDLSIPPLRKFGLAEADVPNMVALAKKSSSIKGNPADLSDAALAAVLREAM
jgi:alcohol dehydrogenase class IV